MNWDGKTIVACKWFVENVSVFLSFVVTINAMAIIKPDSIKLQHRSNGIGCAYNKIKDVIISELNIIRSSNPIIHTRRQWISNVTLTMLSIPLQKNIIV